MSRLFRRLARQAAGTPPLRVHAMAALPFASPSEMLTVQETTTAARAPLTVPPPAAAAAVSPAGNRPADRSAPAPETMVAAHSGETPSRSAPEPSSRGRRARSAKARKANVPAPPEVSSQPPAPSVSGPGAASRRSPPPPVAGVDAAPEAALTAGDTALAVPPPILTAEKPLARPPKREPAPALGGRGTPRSTAPGETPGDGPAEVHVHIGRIEVTAIQEQPAARPKPRAGRPPLSLEDYLARRRGGGA